MSEPVLKFYCLGCQHLMTWKPEFAGRRIRCRHCGHGMAVPDRAVDRTERASGGGGEISFSMADSMGGAPSAAIRLAPAMARQTATVEPALVREKVRPAFPRAGEMPSAAAASQTFDVARPQFPSCDPTDMLRTLYAPVSLLLAGLVLCISYYSIHYAFSETGFLAAGAGLAAISALETGLVIAFALLVARPLAFSFGNVRGAALKLAAIAVFCDGVTSWTDGVLTGIAGSFGDSGLLSFGVIGLPVALLICWGLLGYLFRIDTGDSWMVVVVVAVFYRLLRLILILLLLQVILDLGGAVRHPPENVVPASVASVAVART